MVYQRQLNHGGCSCVCGLGIKSYQLQIKKRMIMFSFNASFFYFLMLPNTPWEWAHETKFMTANHKKVKECLLTIWDGLDIYITDWELTLYEESKLWKELGGGRLMMNRIDAVRNDVLDCEWQKMARIRVLRTGRIKASDKVLRWWVFA